MQYLDGKILQKKFLKEIKEEVALLGIKPVLAVLSIGEDQINDIFFKQIKNMCEYVGYGIEYYYYPDISEDTLLKLIQRLNRDSKITSILLELPILQHLSFDRVRNAILPEKDIEGMTDVNRIKYLNREGGFFSNTVLGIMMMIENYHIDVREKNVVIVNRSEVIGQPLFHYFLSQDCTVTMCHHKTCNLDFYLKQADIVVTATGEAKIFNCNQFKKDSIIIDVGVNYLDGILCGDVDLSCEGEFGVKYVIKSVGGVGAMTVVAIAKSILKSYFFNLEDKESNNIEYLIQE